MSERRPAGASGQPVYSEDDVAEMRARWEAGQKQAQLSTELARIQGQITGFVETIKTTARQVVLEVLAEQKKSEDQSRRANLRVGGVYVAALLVLIVPLEDLVISHLSTGRP